MKTKDIRSLSKYLSLCILLLISSAQIAAHTFSEYSLYSSIQLFRELNASPQYSCPVINASPESNHKHTFIKFHEAENEVEEEEDESFGSRKTGVARLFQWVESNYIDSLTVSDFVQSALQHHSFSNTHDHRYLFFRVFRI